MPVIRPGACRDVLEDGPALGVGAPFAGRGALTSATSSDRLYANEVSYVGQRGSPWLDRSSDAYFERSTKPDVAPCRPLMAPNLAPARSRFDLVISVTIRALI